MFQMVNALVNFHGTKEMVRSVENKSQVGNLPTIPSGKDRWRNSHVLVYHGPLLIHLLGVEPSTFTTVITPGDFAWILRGFCLFGLAVESWVCPPKKKPLNLWSFFSGRVLTSRHA